jgi:hypothetical protein
LEPVLLDQLAHRGPRALEQRDVAAGRGSRSGRSRDTRGRGLRLCPRLGLRHSRRLLRLGGGRCLGGALADAAEQCADGDIGAFADDDLGERAGRGCVHFERHLVGLELDQRIVHGDAVADLLEPARHGRFGHRLAQRGHFDLARHVPAP